MENIIIFVIFAVISSLFNKEKKTKRPQQRSIQMHKPQRKTSQGSLGDLMKELITDFDDVFKEKSPSQREEEKSLYPMNYAYEEQEYVVHEEQEIDNKQEKNKLSSKLMNEKAVYNNEIGNTDTGLTISFDEESLLQGIVMSEILGKPKALR